MTQLRGERSQTDIDRYGGGMAQRTDFGAMACSLARTWSVIGEPWTPLILRDLALGLARFEDLQADLGIARNILADRLRTLVAAGVIERLPSGTESADRRGYVLSARGRELVPLIMAIVQWGDRWLDDGAGPPVLFLHDSCASLSRARLVCDHCGNELRGGEITLLAGPGAHAGPGTWSVDMLPTAEHAAAAHHPSRREP